MKFHSSLQSAALVIALCAVPGYVLAQMSSPKEASSINVARVTYHTAQVDGLKIFYREAGPKSAPTLVLLHGFPSSSHMFRNLIPALSDKYHVIALDYPGFGYSDSPSPEQYAYTFDHLADTVDHFLDQQGITKYSIYIQDYGAPVGFRLATRHPRMETPMTKGSLPSGLNFSIRTGKIPTRQRKPKSARSLRPTSPNFNTRRASAIRKTSARIPTRSTK